MNEEKRPADMNSTPEEPVAPEPNLPLIYIDPKWPSFGAIVRIVVVVLVVMFLAGWVQTLIGSLTYLFFLVVLSIFFAYLIDPLVKLIRRPFTTRSIERFMPRSLAILIAFALVFSTVGIAISNIAPLVVEQGKDFASNLPAYVTTIRENALDLNRRYDRLRLPEPVQERISQEVGRFLDGIAAFFTAVVFGGFLLNLLTFAPWLVLVPILAFFFLKDVQLIRLAILRLFPPGRWRMRADSVLSDVNSTLAAYTRAQLISCLFIGTICTIGFYFLGLRYALLLGILAGIFEFVPLLGPLSIGIIATTTAAFGTNPWRALYVAIFLIVLRVFHDYITYPRIVRGGIHLHPLLIILSVLAGEQVAGIPGVFLAIPIVALFTVIYRHVMEHRGRTRLFDGLEEDEMPSSEEVKA